MKLDRQTARIVVDLQEGIHTLTLISIYRTRKLASVLPNLDDLATRRNQMPPRTFPAGWSESMPELRAQPSNLLVQERTGCARTGSARQAHENSISRIIPKLGEPGTTRELLEAL